MAIRQLVDRIPILLAPKDVERQGQLFSEEAVSETIAGGKTILSITGRKETAQA